MPEDQTPPPGGMPIGLGPSGDEAVQLWFPVEVKVVPTEVGDPDAAAERALARLLRGLESL